DVTFRLYDAAAGGTELLVDRHLAANGQAVVVGGGLFSTQLGGGAVSDGSGAGTYASLADVFRAHASVWVGIEIGAETLSPRLRVVASAYALNADAVDGKNGADLIDTSESFQLKEGRLAVGGSTGDWYGVEGFGFDGGGYFSNVGGNSALIAAPGGVGAWALGTNMGGYFKNTTTLSSPSVVLADATNGVIVTGAAVTGIDSQGSGAAGYFHETDSAASAYVASLGYGIQASGPAAGGYFFDATGSGYAYLGLNDIGVAGYGSQYGGYFRDTDMSASATLAVVGYGVSASGSAGGAQFLDTGGTSNAYIAHGDLGVEAAGNGAGAYLGDKNNSGFSYVGFGDEGIYSAGLLDGGFFDDLDTSSFARVGYSTYKIFGSGSVSFAQNHPYDKDKVIVYVAPEGDEAAVYTRGTARLAGGRARVALGETFALVANPDVGLTAHLTPRGKSADLFVESLGTGEMIVRGPDGSDAEFDYMVWGLRLGFEEQSIVQPKQLESMIPSMADHQAFYASDPSLRDYNALARHTTMERAARGGAAIDLSRSRRMIEAIGVYEPAVDGEVQALHARPRRPEPGARPVPDPDAMSEAAAGMLPAAETAATPVGPVIGLPVIPYEPLAADGPVSPGDVVVLDPASAGSIRRSDIAGDTHVIGCVVEARDPSALRQGEAAVAVSRIATCRAEATERPITSGDLLVVSTIPGHAMAAASPAPGQILGKALDPLQGGTGLIRVLIGAR
ncbi:MAG TPA: hypothetical protein VFD06_03470, partial [Candidatus Polarisedimenticolia bacterium]|nr:hypothetical protein [Candidatus Polarisedimenticolia bacterium]